MTSPFENHLKTELHQEAAQYGHGTPRSSAQADVATLYRRRKNLRRGGGALAATALVAIGGVVFASVAGPHGTDNVPVTLAESPSPTKTPAVRSSPSASASPWTGPPRSRKHLPSAQLTLSETDKAKRRYAKALVWADCMRSNGKEVLEPKFQVRPHDYMSHESGFSIGPENEAELAETLKAAQEEEKSDQAPYVTNPLKEPRNWGIARGYVFSDKNNRTRNRYHELSVEEKCLVDGDVSLDGSFADWEKASKLETEFSHHEGYSHPTFYSSPAITALNKDLTACIHAKGHQVLTMEKPYLTYTTHPELESDKNLSFLEVRTLQMQTARIDLACYAETNALERFYGAVLAVEEKILADPAGKTAYKTAKSVQAARNAAADRIIAAHGGTTN